MKVASGNLLVVCGAILIASDTRVNSYIETHITKIGRYMADIWPIL